MAGQYEGMAIGVFELDSECACFVALDAAAKAADVKIQAVERNRLGAGACVALRAAEPISKIVSHTIIAAPLAETEPAITMTINK